jgi:hypothetical protein
LTMFTGWVDSLFVKPMSITGSWRLLMLVPLTLSVSIVFKTIRCQQLRAVPAASVVLCGIILAGMMSIGVALLIIFRLLA